MAHRLRTAAPEGWDIEMHCVMDCLIQDCLESQLGTGEMVQWVIVFTAKPNGLRPILGPAW